MDAFGVNGADPAHVQMRPASRGDAEEHRGRTAPLDSREGRPAIDLKRGAKPDQTDPSVDSLFTAYGANSASPPDMNFRISPTSGITPVVPYW